MSGIYRGPNSSVAAQFVNADGDKGDIVVSQSGALWTIDALVVDDSKVSSITAAKITTTPSGNLSSTNVQDALLELQGDINSFSGGSTLPDHLSDTTGAHASSAISVTPSGNLGSSDVQAALNELQSDIDSRATSAQGALADSAVQPATIANMVETSDIGVSVQAYDVDTAKLDVAQTFTATQVADNGTGAVSTTSTYTFDGADQIREITLTNTITVTFGAPSGIVEKAMYKLLLKAGDTSARVFAWNSAYKFPSAIPPLTAGTITSGAFDIITFIGGASNTLIYDGHIADVR